MRYLICLPILGRAPEIQISEEEYNLYRNARNVLSNCLAIEEVYEIFISNYLDFEKEIIWKATSALVRDESAYSDFFDVILSLNIRLMNFLHQQEHIQTKYRSGPANLNSMMSGFSA